MDSVFAFIPSIELRQLVKSYLVQVYHISEYQYGEFFTYDLECIIDWTTNRIFLHVCGDFLS